MELCFCFPFKFRLGFGGLERAGPVWVWGRDVREGVWCLVYWSMLYKLFEAGSFKHSVVCFQKLHFQMSLKDIQRAGDFKGSTAWHFPFDTKLETFPRCSLLLWSVQFVSQNTCWVLWAEKLSGTSTSLVLLLGLHPPDRCSSSSASALQIGPLQGFPQVLLAVSPLVRRGRMWAGDGASWCLNWPEGFLV